MTILECNDSSAAFGNDSVIALQKLEIWSSEGGLQ